MTADQKNPIQFLEKVANFLEWSALIPSVLLGAAMVVVVGTGVVARYVMASPMPWTEEASRFLMIWMVLLGLSVVTRRREQMRLTIVACRFPLIFQRISKLTTDIAVLVFLIFLTYYGFEMSLRAKTQFVPSMNITMFLPYLCIPVGGFLTIIQQCLQMAVDISRWKTSISPYIGEIN